MTRVMFVIIIYYDRTITIIFMVVCLFAIILSRPFRIFTGSEDFQTAIYEGPPFKLGHMNKVHTNFVNCVRYSPNGQHAISVGTDKKIQLYDGATGQPTKDISNAHDGGAMN